MKTASMVSLVLASFALACALSAPLLHAAPKKPPVILVPDKVIVDRMPRSPSILVQDAIDYVEKTPTTGTERATVFATVVIVTSTSAFPSPKIAYQTTVTHASGALSLTGPRNDPRFVGDLAFDHLDESRVTGGDTSLQSAPRTMRLEITRFGGVSLQTLATDSSTEPLALKFSSHGADGFLWERTSQVKDRVRTARLVSVTLKKSTSPLGR